LLLAARGARLVLGARRIDRLEALKETIEAAGGGAICLAADVRQRDDLIALVALACDGYGKLDVLVSNAGISLISGFDALCVDDWDAMIDVNIRGVLYGIAAALPVFRRQETGHFVNVISTAGLRIMPSRGVYAATKNAVRTITEALRQEAGGKLHVTGVSPGFVSRDFAESITGPAIKEALANRIGDFAICPDAIAQAIDFAIEKPADVDVGDIVIRPTVQDRCWHRRASVDGVTLAHEQNSMPHVGKLDETRLFLICAQELPFCFRPVLARRPVRAKAHGSVLHAMLRVGLRAAATFGDESR
jgi:NADP-dependent 3-hydroxy acid dehydrogenase YdfG